MYDHMNPSVILCSEELEDTIDMRALHVTEKRDRVINQIEKIPREEEGLETRNQKKKESPTYDKIDNPGNEAAYDLQIPLIPRIIQTAGITTELAMKKEARFTLKIKFLKLF